MGGLFSKSKKESRLETCIRECKEDPDERLAHHAHVRDMKNPFKGSTPPNSTPHKKGSTPNSTPPKKSSTPPKKSPEYSTPEKSPPPTTPKGGKRNKTKRKTRHL